MTTKRGIKPTFKPADDERKLVEQMSAVGIPQEDISQVVRDGIDAKTLRKHFRRELDTGMIRANAKIGGVLFDKAMAGDTTAAIWWSKARMGWKGTRLNENTGKNGTPLHPPTISSSDAVKLIKEFQKANPPESPDD